MSVSICRAASRKDERKHHDTCCEKYEKLLAEKEAERKSITDELKGLEKDIPEELMKIYKDKRKDDEMKEKNECFRVPLYFHF